MMDRPEWIDTFPHALTAIATLTNNNRRGTTPVSVNNPDGSTVAGSARPPVDAINPRVNNVYGHIITWKYDVDWTEPDFEWEIFALCGDPTVPAHGSTIDGDKFGSPDGIYVAPSGRVCGSRPTCRPRRSTPVTMPDLATTRWFAPIRQPERFAGSWLAPSSAKSLV